MLNQNRVWEDEQGVVGGLVESAVIADSHPLAITVVFTTVTATLEALREAGRIAHQLEARIRVLIPSVVPYPLELTRPRVDPLFRLRHFRTVCDQDSVETFLDVRLCRDRLACIRDSLAAHSFVLIGTETGFRFSRTNRRLVTQLRSDGHEVSLVHADKRGRILSWLRSLSPKICAPLG